MAGLIPQAEATISVDFNLDELTDLPGLELLRGPPGPEGPQGEQGPDKTLDIITVSNTETIQRDPGQGGPFIGSSIVECPAETKVTGGGYKHSESEGGSSQNVKVFENISFNNGWKVTAKVDGTNSIQLTAIAICSQLVDSPTQ
jgi:hypothetical protein